MIRPLNELRHRLRFRAWCAVTAARLRRAGGRLQVEAPHGARLDSWPHVQLGSGGTVTLRLGRGVKLGRATHLDLDGNGMLDLGDGVVLWHGVRLQLEGGAIRVGAHVDVRDGVVLKARGELTVGRETVLSYGATVHCAERIEIGEHVAMGERVSVLDSDHTHHRDERPVLQQPIKVAPVTIGRNVLLGANSVVLRGAQVEPNSVVAAGSVVRATRPA